MNTHDLATIGVRLIGLASIAFGIILSASTLLMQALVCSALTQFASSELSIHDSYYVVGHVHVSILPGGVGIVVGVLLFALSRSLAQLLTRGMKK